MNEERMQILTMLSEGKISPEEAEKLMDKMEKQESDGLQRSALSKYLYVKVDPKNEESKQTVRVKVPFTLIRAGINIAGLLPKDVQEKIDGAMDEKGMSFNWSDLKPEDTEELLKALEDFEVNVETENEYVKVYCE